MKTWILLAGLVAVVAASVTLGYEARARPSAAQNCEDWGNQALDRVGIARQLLVPPERGGQSSGSAQGDAQAFFDLGQELANSNPPEEALNLNGDLVEALSAASTALSGGGGASPEAQIAFAKAIIYNADLRLAYLLDGC